jgi:hypothetical protein
MAAPEVVTATLTPEQWAVFSRPVNAARGGGMQMLLRKLLQRANHELRRVTLLPQDLARVRKYAGYCEGGFEDRFRALLAAVDAR